MNDRDKTNQQLDELFNPKSIAIVGLPRELKTGKLYLMALQDQNYPGIIYPVNPKTDIIDGLKSYPSISAIPGSIDLVIILIPNHHTLPVIKECAEKRVKGIILFTAGYSESGTEEGIKLEKEIVDIARSAGMRLIGPNGMGLYAPKSGVSFFPELSNKPGHLSLISHSGSLSNIICGIAPQKGIYFNKAVSLGNESDLSSIDFLDYYCQDEETHVISAYIEGIKDGPRFFTALKRAAEKKPVVLWKVGLNQEGYGAAKSHTGALAGSSDVWKGLVSQCGAIPVTGIEAWLDVIMGFSHLPKQLGNRIAIISGPGGLAVAAAEACGSENLKLSQIAPETKEKLSEFVPTTGTSLNNPIDVGLTASLDIEIYINAARVVASDPGVDAVVVIGIGLSEEANKRYSDAMIQIKQDSGKPFLMVKVPSFMSDFSELFCQAGIPYFESSERALSTYAKVMNYYQQQTNNN